MTARRKFGGTAITNRVRSPSPVRGRGAFEMSKSDERLTRTAAKNLQQAIEVLLVEDKCVNFFYRHNKAERVGQEAQCVGLTILVS